MIPGAFSKRNIGEFLKYFGSVLPAVAWLSADMLGGFHWNLIGAGLCQLASGLILCHLADSEEEIQ